MAKHKIKARLKDNPLTSEPNDFSAVVNPERSLTIKDICESSSSRGGADISASSMSHAVELFLKEMAYVLCDGFSVNTGYFTAVPSIRGVFNSPKESFNADKHTLLFQFTQGESMRKEIANVEIEIEGVLESGTEILQVTDVKSNTVNELLTPFFNLKIIGSKIKIVGDHPEIGVRFVMVEDPNAWFDVDPSDLVTNNPSELMIIIPDMPSEVYKLQITTQFSGSNLLKEPRTVTFDKELRVL